MVINVGPFQGHLLNSYDFFIVLWGIISMLGTFSFKNFLKNSWQNSNFTFST